MAEKNTFLIVVGIIVVVAIVVLVIKPEWLTFTISGNEVIGRTPALSEVNVGSTITVTYKSYFYSGKWGASIIDTLSCPGFPTQTKQFVMTSTEGDTINQTYTVPNQGGIECTFIGDFKFGDKTTKSFPNNIITIKSTCLSRDELGVAINNWIAGTIDRNSLGTKIQSWSQC